MKKSLVTFPIQTGSKKRLITTYRNNEHGKVLKSIHNADLIKLEQSYSLNTDVSFAYTKNQSIKKLVEKHLTNTHFYQFDISNFFASINHQILLDMLVNTPSDFNQRLVYECSNSKPHGLSLGLVPSPFLSNIYLTNFDQKLTNELSTISKTIVFTRYSDDLTISSSTKLNIEEITDIISKLLADVELTINIAKTKYTHLDHKGQHVKVLGLNVICGECSNYITVGRKFKRNTKKENSSLKRHAMEAFIKHNEQ